MQIVSTKPCCRKTGLAGLGFWESLASTAASMFTGGSGGSAGASPTSVTVSPPITVSPQISPVFQQQFQPSGSGMTAGTSQTSVPSYSGAGVPLPAGYAPASSQIPMPAQSAFDQYQKYLPWAALGLGVILIYKMTRKRGSK